MNNRRLSELLMPVTERQASVVVYSFAKIYPHTVRVFTPSTPYLQLKGGMILKKNLASLTRRRGESTETSLDRSIRRTRSKIADYVVCNEFTHFATFTFAKDRQDIAKCKKRMSKWLENQQQRYGKFKYLIVAEFHRDSKSIHFHALLKDYPGEVTPAANKYTGKLIYHNGRQVYNFKGYTHGFSTFVEIDQDAKSTGAVAGYIKKYITKGMPNFPGKKRYWASRDLEKPIGIVNPPDVYRFIHPNWNIATPNGLLFSYDRIEFQSVIGAFDGSN